MLLWYFMRLNAWILASPLRSRLLQPLVPINHYHSYWAIATGEFTTSSNRIAPTIHRNAITIIPFLAEPSIGCDRKPALMQAHCAGAASAAAHHHDTVVLIDPHGHHLEHPLQLDPATRQLEPSGGEQCRRDQAEESKAGNCGAGAGEYQCYEHAWWQ